jgi:hypothetical protein
MAFRRLTISKELADRLDTLAAQHGGLTEAIDHLASRAADDDAAEARSPETVASITTLSSRFDTRRHLPRFEDVTVRFRKGDLRQLNEECLKAGMTRSQWISSLVRSRLSQNAQFRPADRARLATIYRIIIGIEEHLAKIARALSRPDAPLDRFPMRLEEVKAFRVELSSVSDEIRDVLRVSDSYWTAGKSDN